ncbi:MAG: 4Fe-4S binding protein [Candidatus Gastranaerophilales bacterium]|nr:4Fe-4S binding protein [Candidatus Gastranaerophilales bacterium]
MNNLYPVYTLKNECHDCYKCIRECHVKAIKVQENSASVINEKCIACGHCVTVCPSGAKRVRNDVDKVKKLFLQNKEVYVSLAPSWIGAYNISKERMIAALKKLGFKGVSETALGAQEVSIECTRILNSNDSNKLYISSACPVIVDYIRLYKPDYAENIVPVASPLLTHAKLLKEKYGSEIAVVFIGPCIAKKKESDFNQDLVDVSLTFEELNLWMKEDYINFGEIEEEGNENFVPSSAYEGSLYPVEGGMLETIRQSGVKDNKISLISLSSIKNFDKALKGLDLNKIKGKIFVEALGCEGGCVNGPCLSSPKGVISINSDILASVKFRDNIPPAPEVVVAKEYKPNPVVKNKYTIDMIEQALKKIGKNTIEDELNCSGCGYPTCREFAKALIAGDAETSMCVSYMRKTAVKKAAAMVRCMPAAVVMVDKDLNILESNDSFIRMFCPDMYDIFSSGEEGLMGAAIDRIVPFGDIFKSTLKSGDDIRKEHYVYKSKLYDISAFTIETGETAGAVITDVTKSETDREKTARRAREVISKNIATVQEIACLLGEHMVETELLLNSIAQDYENAVDEEQH